MVHFRNGRLHEWPGAPRSVPQISSTTSLKKDGPRVLSQHFCIGSHLSCGWGNYSDVSQGHRKWWCKITIKAYKSLTKVLSLALRMALIFATSPMGDRNGNYSNLP